ncbi:uncharacterized protein LOC122556575 isoform X2 [Chiloscyllium plagiosum]|uniref:uncharacterized protein LOC122556575 isoform X2 n=1 Tax=Chiloscyllium plagiosum TaxID=36176 RepID=UPI001CB7CE53|nr:uncharacterized protein LOC122556575 isoform X2 [Chiloscyllium plagiosum]
MARAGSDEAGGARLTVSAREASRWRVLSATSPGEHGAGRCAQTEEPSYCRLSLGKRIRGLNDSYERQIEPETNVCKYADKPMFFPCSFLWKEKTSCTFFKAVTADVKPSSKLKKLSLIYEEADSELYSTNKVTSRVHRSTYQSRMKRTVRRNILKTKKETSPFQNRSPSLQQWKEFTQSNSKNADCSVYNETTSEELCLTTETLAYVLPSLDSELLVDDSSSIGTENCSSVELFREPEDHASVMNPEDIYWFSCKNSTLLDSSKAANIDVIGQPSNLSEILEQTGNLTREGNFKGYHVLDEVEVYGNSEVTSFTVAGKTVSKLQASKEITLEQKKLHAVSLRDEQKKSAVKTKKTFKPKQTSTPVETFKQPTKLKQQDEVPICSIILAPVCDRPSDALQCEQVKHWTSLENAPIDIIIDLSK